MKAATSSVRVWARRVARGLRSVQSGPRQPPLPPEHAGAQRVARAGAGAPDDGNGTAPGAPAYAVPVPDAASPAYALPMSYATSTPVPPELVRQSLRTSIKEGLAWAVMSGAGARYVEPFVILAGSSPLAVGALSFIPNFGQALVQWLGANYVDRGGRRKATIVRCMLLQALMWGPICLAIFLPQPASYLLLLVAYALAMFFDSFGIPAWNSLMGDLVPADRRGWFFGFRNSLISLAIVGVFVSGGWWLSYCERTPGLARWTLASKDFGFLALFVIAGLARLVSARYMNRMHDPPYVRTPSDDFSLLDFLRRAPRANFGRFVFYLTLIHIGYGFMGPFYGWYLLDQCQFTTGVYANILVVGLAIGVFTQALWGRLADRVGNKRIITICGIGAIFFPLLLIFCRSPWHFAAVQLYDGVMTAGFAIATGNYIFDVVSPPKRARCVAYYTLFITVGIALGAFPGALVAKYVPMPLVLGPLSITHAFQLLLVGSVIFRLLANVLMLGSFQEFRLSRPVFVPEGRRAA